jgi:hypothetical protein
MLASQKVAGSRPDDVNDTIQAFTACYMNSFIFVFVVVVVFTVCNVPFISMCTVFCLSVVCYFV